MQFLKNNIWTFCLVAVFSLLTFAGDASAQSSVMQTSQEKALNVFTAVKTMIFGGGGCGWAGSIVNYATGENMSGFQDSFDNATN